MTWTKLSDDFFDREQMLHLERDARLLHVEALVWCNRAGSDGRVPRAALGKVTDLQLSGPAIESLVATGLWTETDTGWQIDWVGEHQETSERVEKRRKDNAERQARFRAHQAGDHSLCDYCAELKKLHKLGDHRFCSPDDCTGSNAASNALRNATPTPPTPKGVGGGERPSLRCPGGVPVAADGSCCGKDHEPDSEPVVFVSKARARGRRIAG